MEHSSVQHPDTTAEHGSAPPSSRNIPLLNKRAVIVGAGIFGVNAALRLGSHGYKVTLIDPLGIGRGTTSQSTEMVRLHHVLPTELWCTLRTLEMATELKMTTQISYLFAYYDSQSFKVAESQQILGWEYGVDLEIYDQKESLEKFPFLRQQVGGDFLLGTSTCSEECRIDVTAMCNEIFRKSGAEFVQDKVIEIRDDGRPVTRKNGILNADLVIIAAGPWTGAVANHVGDGEYLPIVPVPYYTFRTSGKKPIPYMLVLPGGVYFHPEHPEIAEFAVGGISGRPGFSPPALPRDRIEGLVCAANRYLSPDYILDPRARVLTSGSYDITPPHTLLIKQSETDPNVYFFAGGNGHGVMMSVGAAMLLEEFLGLSNDPERKRMLDLMSQPQPENVVL
ncbi:MAG: FAD-binding oxidoreductase [Bacteroidetes bacterium]|nr:FAD-binding oxidoreductase [Bacteroidota bacterium]